MKRFLLLSLAILPLMAVCQTMSVSEFYLDAKDLTATNEETKKIDDNGQVCALIRIETTQTGFTFDGGTIGVVAAIEKVGEIWLYVPAGLRRITIRHQQLGTLRDYYFTEQLQPARTYVMKLVCGTTETVVKQKSNQQYFVLTYEPVDAMVEIDGNIVEGNNGTVSMKLPYGRHDYRVSSNNYHTEAGVVNIGQEKAFATVKLKPAFGWIEINGANGASVYIDNHKVGETPMKSEAIASGTHDVRVTKDLYLPFRQQVLVNDNTVSKVDVRLTANYVNVTLNVADNAEIWVNDEMKGNGTVSVSLSPGEYTFETRKTNHRSQSIVRSITMATEGAIELPAPVAITGTLEVDVTPVGAKVFLDGKHIGESPLLLDDVLIGEHSVKITATNMQDEMRKVVVEEGKTVVIKKSMIHFVGEIAPGITLDLTNADDARWYEMDLEDLYKLASETENETIKARMYAIGAYKGHSKSQNRLGNCYYSGKGVSQYYYEAAKWYRKAAEQGYEWGQYNLGLCYYDGKGVTQNYTEAVKWYKKAAEQNNSSAQNRLGNCYYSGEGVNQDYIEAVKWYRKSAENGYDYGQLNLGNCFYDGKGVTQNYKEAANWYRKAAEQNNSSAQNKLGNCYYSGKGVNQDYNEAVKWYRKSAENGYDWGQYNLGDCYDSGEGVNKDYIEAVKWYRKAAEQNNSWAQNRLGICYYKGQGVSQDYVEAVKWYRKSAENGYDWGQYNLGDCYYRGEGVSKDYSESVKWCRKAAEQGNTWAQFGLGISYLEGNGVLQNYYEAVKWFRKSAESGYDRAQNSLGDCYYYGKGVTQDYTEAVRWYRKAAENGYDLGQYNMGWCYENGNGIIQDNYGAAKWYRRAAEQGNENAKIALRRLGFEW